MAVLRVKGRCPKCGQEVETDALPKRATWRGACPKDGCDGRIVATRIKAPAPSTSSTTPAPAKTPDGGQAVTSKPPARGRGRRVVKAGYERTVPPADGGAPAARTPKPAKRPAAAPGAGKPADGPGSGAGADPPPAKPVRSDRTEDGRHHAHPAGRYGFNLW